MSWRFESVDGGPFDGPLDGPVWDGTGLLFSRPEAKELQRFDPATGRTERFRHSTSGNRGLAIGPDGRLFGAQTTSRRVVWYAPSGETFYLEAMLDGARHNDPQDLVVDGQGRIWFSDDWTADSIGGPVGWPPLAHHSILRLARIAETDDGIGDWRLERMTHDTSRPRGLGLAADEGTLFVIDRGDGATIGPTLRAYPVTDDGLGTASILHAYPPDPDAPDVGRGPHGLTIDREGRILVCVGPTVDDATSRIEVFAPDGRSLDRHPVDAGVPTNAAFGGTDGRTLFVTTREGHLLRAAETDG